MWSESGSFPSRNPDAARVRIPLPGDEKKMNPGDMPGAADLEAARAAVLILSAAHKAPSSAAGLQLDGEALSADEAVRRLASLPKPLTLSSELLDGRVSIRPDVPDPSWPELPEGGGVFRHAREGSEPGRTDIQLEGASDHVLLSLEGMETLLRDYVIQVPYGLAGDLPTDTQQEQGIRWIVRVGGVAITTTNVDDLGLDEPLRSIIAEEFRKAQELGGGRDGSAG